MWSQTPREFVGWYVNLQEPVRRTWLGFDFMDQDLDIVFQPDAREWHWKDEEVMQQGLELGIYTAQQVRDIRAEGERVVERIRRRTAPFDNSWLDWKPDAACPIPELSPGWDQL
jgi:protein associated with RNAse G/E